MTGGLTRTATETTRFRHWNVRRQLTLRAKVKVVHPSEPTCCISVVGSVTRVTRGTDGPFFEAGPPPWNHTHF